MKKQNRRLVCILILGFILLNVGSPAVTAAQENLFVYAHGSTFPNIDPSFSFSNDLLVLANAYETLTFYNLPGSDEVLSPRLATGWEANEDATEWTFFLRKGVKFHDGTDFNAAAVKYSIERTMNLGKGAAFIWDPVQAIEVVDAYTVKFKLKYSAPLDLIAAATYAAWIFSPAAVETQGERSSEWFNAGHSAGTGPYRIESRKLGKKVTMTRFDDYWDGWKEDQFDTIIFEVVVDAMKRQKMIEFGAADFTSELSSETFVMLDARDDITVYTNPSFQNLLGFFNTKKEPLTNKLVRQALSYTFPYQQFNEERYGDNATQSHGPVPAGVWGHSEELFQYTYNLDKARELLTEAGYPDGGFNLVMTYVFDLPDEKRMGQLWQAELAKLGIQLELQPMEWEAQWDLAKSDPLTAQDIFVMYWWPSWITPYDYLFNMFHCEEEILFNLGYYCNPKFDELIDKANELSGSQRAEAERLFIKAQKILIEDAPAIFFFDIPNTHALRSDIKGYVDNPAYPHVVFVYKLQRK